MTDADLDAAARRPAPFGPVDRIGLLLPVAAVVLGAAFFRGISGDAPVHADTLRDLLMARECVELGRCGSIGAVSSVGGLAHGGSYGRLLALVLGAGGTVATVQTVLASLVALASLVVACTVPVPSSAPHRVRQVRAVAFALALAATAIASEAPSLFGPLLLPLPTAVFFAGLVRLAREGDARAVVLAAIGAAFATDVHVMSAPLLLVLVVASAACARRPMRAATLALVLVALVFAGTSAEALVWNASRLRGQAFALVGLVVLAFVLGTELRARAARGDEAVRARRVLLAASGAWLLAFALAAPWIAHGAGVRYLLPVLPALVALLAPRLVPEGAYERTGRGRAAFAFVFATPFLLAAGAVGAKRATTPYWRIDEVGALVPALRAQGLGHAAIVRHLRGPDAFAVAAMTGAFLPREPAPADPLGDDDLLVVRVEHASPAPAGVRVVPLGGSVAAWTRRLRPYLDRHHIEGCDAPPDRPSTRCRTVDALAFRPDEGADGLSHRAYVDPTRARGGGGAATSPPARWVRIPVSVPVGARPHRLTLGNVGGRFRFVRAEGSLLVRRMRGRAELELELVAGEGTLLFERRARAEDHEPRGALPEWIETTPDEASLRAAIDRALW